MEETTTLQKFISAPVLSKEAQANVAADLVAQVVNGNVDPITAFVQMKAVGEVAEQFLKNADIVALTQAAAAERGKDAQFGGAKVGITYTTRYDYMSSGDAEYAELMRAKEDIDTKIKSRQMFLKSVTDTMEVVDRATGEVVTINAPIPTKSSTIRVTFAKQ